MFVEPMYHIVALLTILHHFMISNLARFAFFMQITHSPTQLSAWKKNCCFSSWNSTHSDIFACRFHISLPYCWTSTDGSKTVQNRLRKYTVYHTQKQKTIQSIGLLNTWILLPRILDQPAMSTSHDNSCNDCHQRPLCRQTDVWRNACCYFFFGVWNPLRNYFVFFSGSSRQKMQNYISRITETCLQVISHPSVGTFYSHTFSQYFTQELFFERKNKLHPYR